MDIVSKGSKPVIYKSNMRLKFYAGAIEDSKVTVTHIFTKVNADGSAVAYGEYVIFLLFSYLNSQNHKEYITEQKNMKFCEEISCNLPDVASDPGSESQYDNAGATFEPRISCTAGTGGIWNVAVEGQFDVLVYGEKAAFDIHLPVSDLPASDLIVKNYAENATVVQLEDTGISTNELLDMDTESIKNMTSKSDTSTDAYEPAL